MWSSTRQAGTSQSGTASCRTCRDSVIYPQRQSDCSHVCSVPASFYFPHYPRGPSTLLKFLIRSKTSFQYIIRRYIKYFIPFHRVKTLDPFFGAMIDIRMTCRRLRVIVCIAKRVCCRIAHLLQFAKITRV